MTALDLALRCSSIEILHYGFVSRLVSFRFYTACSHSKPHLMKPFTHCSRLLSLQSTDLMDAFITRISFQFQHTRIDILDAGKATLILCTPWYHASKQARAPKLYTSHASLCFAIHLTHSQPIPHASILIPRVLRCSGLKQEDIPSQHA